MSSFKKMIVGADGNSLVIEDGKIIVRIEGNTFQEQKTETHLSNGNLTFSAPINTIEIYNTDETEGTFTVNGLSIKLPPGNLFKAKINGPSPSAIIGVTGTTKFIVSRYT